MTRDKVKRIVEVLQDVLMADDCLGLAIQERTGRASKRGQQSTEADRARARELHRTRATWRTLFS